MGMSAYRYFYVLYFKRQAKVLNKKTIYEKSMGMDIIENNNWISSKEKYLEYITDQTKYIAPSINYINRMM